MTKDNPKFPQQVDTLLACKYSAAQKQQVCKAIISGKALEDIQTDIEIDELTYLKCKAALFEYVRESHILLLQAHEELSAQEQDAFNNALEKVVADSLEENCCKLIAERKSAVLMPSVA